jgi:hypothetical protein
MGRQIYDPVTVATAAVEYQDLKPGSGHRVTLASVARRHRISVDSLFNFRRSESPNKFVPKGNKPTHQN